MDFESKKTRRTPRRSGRERPFTAEARSSLPSGLVTPSVLSIVLALGGAPSACQRYTATVEERFLLWVHDNLAHPIFDEAFYVSHFLGTAPFCTALVVVAAGWWAIRGRRREAMLWIVLGISTYLLQKGLKVAFERPRPHLWDGALRLSSYAFPSGHAVAGATFSWLMARSALRGWPRGRRRVVFIASAMALYIGFGRLYLGVHWPSDVLAGWSLGALQTWLVTRWFRS